MRHHFRCETHMLRAVGFAGLLLLASSQLICVAQDVPEDVRAAVPAVADQTKTLGEIKDIFADDYTKAKKPDDKGALARTLLQQVDEQKDDEIARYVLLKESLRLAQDGLDVETALTCIEMLGDQFQVDAFALLHDALDDLSKKAKTSQALKAINDANKVGIEKAVAADKFPVATKMCVIGDRLSLAAKDTIERKRYLDTKTAIAAQQKEFDASERAKEVLAKKPDDAAANFDRGVYLLTRKRDWQAGLEHLSKSGDSELRALAALDLSNPSSTKKRLELAEGWFDWTPTGKKVKPAWSKALAQYWYSQVATEVTGLDKTKVEKKLKELGDLDLKRDESGAAVASATTKRSKSPLTGLASKTNPGNVVVTGLQPVIRPVGKLPAVGELPPKPEVKSPYMSGPLVELEPDQKKLTQEIFKWSLTTPGVQLTYRFQNGTSSAGMKYGKVPPDGPYAFVLINAMQLNDEQFQVFKGLKTVDHVLCQSSGTTGAWLKYLDAATYLRTITVTNQSSFQENFAADLAKCRNLNQFTCTVSPIGPKVIKSLADLPALEFLNLKLSPNVTPLDLSAFRRTHLQGLTLTAATEAHALALEGTPKLTQLTLDDVALSDAGLAQLQSLPLTSLSLMNSQQLTGAGLAAWKQSSLTRLHLYDCRSFTDAGMAGVYALPSLRDLTVARIPATFSFAKLKSAPNITSLHLDNVKASDWDGLSNYRSLTTLYLRSGSVPLSLCKEAAKLPLTFLGLDQTDVTDDHIKHFAGHPTLRTLSLNSTKVTPAGIQALKGSSPQLNVFKSQ